MSNSGLISLVVSALAWLGPPTSAEPRPELEDGPGLAFDPAMPERDRKTIGDEFARALPIACTPPPCVAECEPGQRTLGLHVSGEDRIYALRFVIRDPALPNPMVVESTCELCSIAEVATQMRAELARVCERVARLDDANDELEHETDDDPRCTEAPARRRPTWPGWLSLGTGLALGIAGATLIGIDAAPYRRQCSGSDVDALGHCRYRLATAPLGIGFAIAGGVALGTGIGLAVWAHPGGSRGGESRAGVSLTWRF